MFGVCQCDQWRGVNLCIYDKYFISILIFNFHNNLCAHLIVLIILAMSNLTYTFSFNFHCFKDGDIPRKEIPTLIEEHNASTSTFTKIRIFSHRRKDKPNFYLFEYFGRYFFINMVLFDFSLLLF